MCGFGLDFIAAPRQDLPYKIHILSSLLCPTSSLPPILNTATDPANIPHQSDTVAAAAADLDTDHAVEGPDVQAAGI